MVRTLTCERCGVAIASVDDRSAAFIAASLCERCAHPAYYDGASGAAH